MSLYKIMRTVEPRFDCEVVAIPTDEWPGPWLGELDSEPSIAGRAGYALTRLGHLPSFLGRHMVEAEIHPKAGVRDYGPTIQASCIRLTRRVEAWDVAAATQFAAECLDHILPGVYHPADPLAYDIVIACIFEAEAASRGMSAMPPLFNQARKSRGISPFRSKILDAAAASIGLACGGCDDDRRYVPWRVPAMIAHAVHMEGDTCGLDAAAVKAWQATRLMQYLKGRPEPFLPNSTAWTPSLYGE